MRGRNKIKVWVEEARAQGTRKYKAQIDRQKKKKESQGQVKRSLVQVGLVGFGLAIFVTR